MLPTRFPEEPKLYYQGLLRAACGIVQNTQIDPEDVVSDAFMLAFQRLGTFGFRSQFSTWLHTIAHNCFRSIQRRPRPNVVKSIDPIFEGNQVDPHYQPIESGLVQMETQEKVRTALGQLKKEYHKIIILRHFKQLDYQKIADSLQISTGAVRSRLRRARAALLEGCRQLFEDDSPENDEVQGDNPEVPEAESGLADNRNAAAEDVLQQSTTEVKELVPGTPATGNESGRELPASDAVAGDVDFREIVVGNALLATPKHLAALFTHGQSREEKPQTSRRK
ncbi:MAG: sigma-70 family RNA polymerase sigma factor [Candidatus Peribacteraceae bacterium]|nr:sigma-70 family RNA polymerase sigma factor [Candidatus Peribacteraceae bacterium]